MTEEKERRSGTAADLDRRLADLATEVAPRRDLWPGIEARLDDESEDHSASWWNRAAVAAAVCVAALLPLLLIDAPGPEEPMPLATVPQQTTPAFDTAGQRLRLLSAATTSVKPGPEYQAARFELLGQLEERLGGLEPEEREIVVRNIEAIRNALEEIDMALQDSPDDPLLQEMMLKTYQSELDVIARVNGLAGPATRRTDL